MLIILEKAYLHLYNQFEQQLMFRNEHTVCDMLMYFNYSLWCSYYKFLGHKIGVVEESLGHVKEVLEIYVL